MQSTSGKGRTRKTYDLPMRVRRRQSDARWRANVASCFETLKHVIPVNKRAGKRQISKALILQETAKHITFLEGTLRTLLQEKGKLEGHSKVEVWTQQSMHAVMEEFIEKQRNKLEAMNLEKRYKRNKCTKVYTPDQMVSLQQIEPAESSSSKPASVLVKPSRKATKHCHSQKDSAGCPEEATGACCPAPSDSKPSGGGLLVSEGVRLCQDGDKITVKNTKGNASATPVIGRVIVIAPNRENVAKKSKVFKLKTEKDKADSDSKQISSKKSAPSTPSKRKPCASPLGSPERKRLNSPGAFSHKHLGDRSAPNEVPSPLAGMAGHRTGLSPNLGCPSPFNQVCFSSAPCSPAPYSPAPCSPAHCSSTSDGSPKFTSLGALEPPLSSSELFPELLTPTKLGDSLQDYTPLKQKQEEGSLHSSGFTPVHLPPQSWVTLTPTPSPHGTPASTHSGTEDWTSDTDWDSRSLRCDEDISEEDEAVPNKGKKKRPPNAKSCYRKYKKRSQSNRTRQDSEISIESQAEQLNLTGKPTRNTKTRRSLDMNCIDVTPEKKCVDSWAHTAMLTMTGRERQRTDSACSMQDFDRYLEEYSQKLAEAAPEPKDSSRTVPTHIDALWDELMADHDATMTFTPLKLPPSNKDTKITLSLSEDLHDIQVEPIKCSAPMEVGNIGSDDSFQDYIIDLNATDEALPSSDDSLLAFEQCVPVGSSDGENTLPSPEELMSEQECPLNATDDASQLVISDARSLALDQELCQEVPSSSGQDGSCQLDLQLDLKALSGALGEHGLRDLLEEGSESLALAHWSQVKSEPWTAAQ